MGRFKSIGVVMVAVILLGGCTLPSWASETDPCLKLYPANSNEINPQVPEKVFEGENPYLPYVECEADWGSQYFQYVLGTYYLEANGVPQDYKRAAKFFKKAAKARSGYTQVYTAGFGSVPAGTRAYKTGENSPGYAKAQFELAKLYLEGKGVKKSESKARKWLRRAANSALEEATELLQEIEG